MQISCKFHVNLCKLESKVVNLFPLIATFQWIDRQIFRQFMQIYANLMQINANFMQIYAD